MPIQQKEDVGLAGKVIAESKWDEDESPMSAKLLESAKDQFKYDLKVHKEFDDPIREDGKKVEEWDDLTDETKRIYLEERLVIYHEYEKLA